MQEGGWVSVVYIINLSCSGYSVIQNWESQWEFLQVVASGTFFKSDEADEHSGWVWSNGLLCTPVRFLVRPANIYPDEVKKNNNKKLVVAGRDQWGQEGGFPFCFGYGFTERANVCQRVVMSESGNCFPWGVFTVSPHGLLWVCFCALSLWKNNRRIHRNVFICCHNNLVIRPSHPRSKG